MTSTLMYWDGEEGRPSPEVVEISPLTPTPRVARAPSPYWPMHQADFSSSFTRLTQNNCRVHRRLARGAGRYQQEAQAPGLQQEIILQRMESLLIAGSQAGSQYVSRQLGAGHIVALLVPLKAWQNTPERGREAASGLENSLYQSPYTVRKS